MSEVPGARVALLPLLRQHDRSNQPGVVSMNLDAEGCQEMRLVQVGGGELISSRALHCVV